LPSIHQGDVHACKHYRRIHEIKPALKQRAIALRGAELNSH
jgi:hypothetical protein